MAGQLVGASGAAVRLGDAVMGVATGVKRWVAYRDTVSALRGLSPRELQDIGVEAAVEDFADDITNTRIRG